MAYVNNLFDQNFLEYASYVIKDRAIPHLDDGLKPVQRRILHSLYEMDDGKYNKVANVVGHCMKYHPHGDASIYSALVVLANKDIFIDKQGNFGNIYTGDEASAARYIECRLLPLAKDILFNPEITQYESSYDGRNQEPITFPAKIPIVLIQGAEGIAVGMSTKILPHNFCEVLEAVKACLLGKNFKLYPDFPTGGMVDVSEYADGVGKVLVRAKLDTSDSKRIVVKDLPFGSTTESLINSIENAAKKNKIKVLSISDFTTDQVEIEIKLPRGVNASEVVDGLYAFTDCETSISVNLLVIKDHAPVVMTITEVIQHHAKQIIDVLKAELKLEEGKLLQRLHDRTLDQIFIEERIYKNIEQMKTQEKVIQAVFDGFKPFAAQIKREVSLDDVERLLKIAIRRISLYDINKVKQEIKEIIARVKEIREHLKKLVEYAISYLDGILAKEAKNHERKTELLKFEKVDVKEAAQRNLKLYYNDSTGYLGTNASGGKSMFDVSIYDKILVIRKSGAFSVIKIPDKLFVDTGMLFCSLAEKEILSRTVFTAVYKDNESGNPFIKRCQIEKFIMGKGYSLVPDGCTLLGVGIGNDISVVLDYAPKPRIKILEETVHVKDYLVKSLKASGVRVANREVTSVRFVKIMRKGYAQEELAEIVETQEKKQSDAVKPQENPKPNATPNTSKKESEKSKVTKKKAPEKSKKTESKKVVKAKKSILKKKETKTSKKSKKG